MKRIVKVREVAGSTVVTIPKAMQRAWKLLLGSHVILHLQYVVEDGKPKPVGMTIRKT